MWRNAATGGQQRSFDTDDSAIFSAGSGTATISTIVNGGVVNANAVTFTSGAGAYTITGGTRLELTGAAGTGITNNSTSLQTISSALRLNGANRTFNAASGNILISGTIDEDAGGARTLTKTGNQALTLSGNNSYTGTTTVSAGTLFANNSTSSTGTGAVSVAIGATLGGNGTIAAGGSNGINVSGVLAPGASVGTVGTLTFAMGGTTGKVTMASGSSFAFELGLGGADFSSLGSSDMISLTNASSGDFVFNGNNINLQNTGTNGFYKLFDTSSNNTNTWTGLTVNGSGVITAGLTFSNLAAGKTGTLILGNGTNGGTSGDIYLSVVPEPSSALLAGLGSCLLFRRRRNRS
jgi:fibronectin-binding autotransporter adhesin